MAASASPRSMWNGNIAFGLVNVPVKLIAAVREERVGFHLLHDQDHVRLQQRMVCPHDGQEVHPEHRVKGFEVAPEQYVIVRDEELEAVRPSKSRDITIESFVKPEEIDPRMFDRPYYLLPGENGAKNYRLLVMAMEKRGRVAVARFVMRGKDYLAAIRPVGEVLALYTMRFHEEVIDVGDAEWPGGEVKGTIMKVDDREMRMAMQLVESLVEDFEPGKYRNDYVDKVKTLIEAKARGEEVETHLPVERKGTAGKSLADVLAASLKRVKGGEVEEVHRKAKVETHHRARPTTKKK